MQSLGFSPSVYACERLIWTARPFYRFLFLENSNLKIYSFSKNTFIKGKLLFFNQLPLAPHFALWEKDGSRWGGWGWTGNWKCCPLVQCDDGLFSRPDASGGLQGSGMAGDGSALSAWTPALWSSWSGQVLPFSKGVFQNPFFRCSRVDRYRKAS